MEKLGLTDRPVSSLSEESLGVKDYMEALSKFIVTCETPMTISIQADWGAGKTSMMNLVKTKLEDENIETIWFNTWQFSQFNMGDDLPIALLGQFAKKFSTSGSEVKDKLKAGVKALARIGSKQIGLEDAYDAMNSNNTDSAEIIIELKENLNKAVKTKINNSANDRVVIFIDDLDRLVPEKAVELLETMKLFLDIPGCVFILAIDYNVVVKGLEKKFGVSVDEAKGKSFFDKIIQLPFNLPVAQYDLSKYFKELLHGKFEYKEEDIDTFVKLANNSVGFNPRSMKRLFNSLQLLKMVAATKNILGADSIATAYEKQRILFAILCLQTAYESMYRFMLKHQSKIDQEFFDTFSELEKLKESDYYSEVKKELNIKDDEDDKVVRFIEFINTFYEAIQLESDDSEDSSDNLSDKELENLMRFLSFSSITTSNSQGINASAGTFQFKSLVKPFLDNELTPRYQEYMSSISSKFDIWSDNNSGSIYFKYSVADVEFLFVFWRNPQIFAVTLDHEDGDKAVVKRFIQNNIKDKFPKFEYNGRKRYGFLELLAGKYTDEEMRESEEYRNEHFQKIIIESMDKLSVLQDYYIKAKPIIEKIHNFIDKIEQQLLKTFDREKGWKINMNNIKELKSYQSISITNSRWGEGKYNIYLSSFTAYFNRPYIGVSLNKDFKNADKYQKEILYKKLEANFDNVSNTSHSFFRSNLDMKQPIEGDMYNLNNLGTYAYHSNEEEDKAVEYIVKSLARVVSYTSDFTKLANGNK